MGRRTCPQCFLLTHLGEKNLSSGKVSASSMNSGEAKLGWAPCTGTWMLICVFREGNDSESKIIVAKTNDIYFIIVSRVYSGLIAASFQVKHSWFWGFPDGASGKESSCQCRRCKRCWFNPWAGKIPWSRKWQPLQYSCLEHPMPRGAWGLQSTGSQRVKKQLSDRAHIVDLQCWVSFWCTAKWFIFIHMHSFPYYFLLWFITRYWI